MIVSINWENRTYEFFPENESESETIRLVVAKLTKGQIFSYMGRSSRGKVYDILDFGFSGEVVLETKNNVTMPVYQGGYQLLLDGNDAEAMEIIRLGCYWSDGKLHYLESVMSEQGLQGISLAGGSCETCESNLVTILERYSKICDECAEKCEHERYSRPPIDLYNSCHKCKREFE